MNKKRSQSVVLLLAFALVAIPLVWLAYERYAYVNEEGLVYVGIFEPNPYVAQFDSVIAMSKPSICRSDKLHYVGLSQELVANFIGVNENVKKPIRLAILEGQVPIVSWEDTKNLYKKGVEEFFRPKDYRLIKLSRVGFSDDFTEALACVESSDEYYGQADLIHLEKIGEGWKIIKVINIWVS